MSSNPDTTTVGDRFDPVESEPEGSLREKAHQVREQIGAKTRETTSRVKAEGEHLLRDQKDRVAERIRHYGGAVHRAADKLEDEQDATIAQHIHRAAEQIERAADYLRSRDWQGLRRDVEGLARRHPEMFFGGLLVAGLAVARLLKASREEEEDAFRSEGARGSGMPGTHATGASGEHAAAGYVTPAYRPVRTTLPQSSALENPNL
jgi:hypothetical protein